NLRLGMVLQIAAAAGGYYGGSYAERIPEHALQLTFAAGTAGAAARLLARAGGYCGASYAERIPEHALQLTFAAVTAVIAAIMLSRLERRNVILDTSIERGPFGGRYYRSEEHTSE